MPVDVVHLRPHDGGDSRFLRPFGAAQKTGDQTELREHAVDQLQPLVISRRNIDPADDLPFGNGIRLQAGETDTDVARACELAPLERRQNRIPLLVIAQGVVLPCLVGLGRIKGQPLQDDILPQVDYALLDSPRCRRDDLLMNFRVQDIDQNTGRHCKKSELGINKLTERVFFPILAESKQLHGLIVVMDELRLVDVPYGLGIAAQVDGRRADDHRQTGLRVYRWNEGRRNLVFIDAMPETQITSPPSPSPAGRHKKAGPRSCPVPLSCVLRPPIRSPERRVP